MGRLYDDYGELITYFPAWTPAAIAALPRSHRAYWAQFGRATYERREKKTGDLITKLVEHADKLLSARRR